MNTPLDLTFINSKTGVSRGMPIFHIFAHNIDCGYLLEPLGEAVLTCTHNLCYEQKYKKKSMKIFNILQLKNLCISQEHVFVM